MPKIPGVAGPVSVGAAASAGGMFCGNCCVPGPLGALGLISVIIVSYREPVRTKRVRGENFS